MSIKRYPFPYVPNTLFSVVDGTVQPVTDIDPDDPEGGTYQLLSDPLDATVYAYARISPDAVPAPDEIDGVPIILPDVDDDFEEDDDIVDAEDDETEDDDPDAPSLPDD